MSGQAPQVPSGRCLAAVRNALVAATHARVSTLDQDPALQLDALTAAGCDRVFVNKASGKLASRPALDDLLRQLRPGDGQVLGRGVSASAA